MVIYSFPSELGWMALSWEANQLTRLTFGQSSGAAAALSLKGGDVDRFATTQSPPQWVLEVCERLQSYAAGNDERFDEVPLDLSHLTRFQNQVVKACRAIRRGRVRTYGELAASVGTPGAARAVGSVMAKNRFPIIIPCHRVVGSSGSLGGFSADGGITVKRRMLEMEGVALKPQPGASAARRTSRPLSLAGA